MFLLTVLLSLKQFEGKHVFIFLVCCIRFVAAGVEKEKEGEKKEKKKGHHRGQVCSIFQQKVFAIFLD